MNRGTHHHISHWWIVLITRLTKNCVVLFFLHMNKRNSLAKNFENVLILKQNNAGEKSVSNTKVTFCFQIQVQSIEENIERQQGVICLLLL